jgi:hypothetical protein
MPNLTIKHHAFGANVVCDCKHVDLCDNDLCNDHTIGYLVGRKPPNYPAPVPFEEQWQFFEWFSTTFGCWFVWDLLYHKIVRYRP